MLLFPGGFVCVATDASGAGHPCQIPDLLRFGCFLFLRDFSGSVAKKMQTPQTFCGADGPGERKEGTPFPGRWLPGRRHLKSIGDD
jgi:hypothetical protein